MGRSPTFDKAVRSRVPHLHPTHVFGSRSLPTNQRRLDAAVQEKAAALAESSREASKAAATARERISRLEAEHSLALRENGKVSVRQRALEREVARIKTRCDNFVCGIDSNCCCGLRTGTPGVGTLHARTGVKAR